VDNGSDHRGKKAARRLRDAHPNAIMIHTPVHAYWLNQAEIVFSIVQKEVISPNDFATTAQLAATLLASSTGTTRTPGRSTGSSPQPTWPGSSSRSAPAQNPPACHRPLEHPDELTASPA